ncbi:hypothetical protein JW968_05120 [Candidatus Woesearchaeota archaeon]|nr:hypothetical protein [Candidatus Woesearchaeota archaeon]
MMDIFFKYGMVVVALVVIVMTLGFVRKAVNSTSGIGTDQQFQEFEGSPEHVANAIVTLCSRCLEERDMNRDCYILKVTLEGGPLDEDIINERIYLINKDINVSEELAVGVHELKFRSDRNICRVVRID